MRHPSRAKNKIQLSVDTNNRLCFSQPRRADHETAVEIPLNLQLETRMSLETAIAELTAAVKEQNELTREILSKAAAAGARSSASSNSSASTDDGGEDKPKRTRASKSTDDKTDDKKADTKAVTLDDVKPILSSWLNEFPKNGDEDHPETAARKAEFRKILEKFGANALPAVPADKFGDLKTWAEGMKAKGRLVKEDDADEGDGDDDMLG